MMEMGPCLTVWIFWKYLKVKPLPDQSMLNNLVPKIKKFNLKKVQVWKRFVVQKKILA